MTTWPLAQRFARLGMVLVLTGLATFTAAASDVLAQPVIGVLVKGETGESVEGAMIILLDQAGDVVDRALTDVRGGFSLDADSPGIHSLAIERIGIASTTHGPFHVGPEGVIRRVSAVEEAIELAGIEVTGEHRCVVRPDVGRTTALVWDEARKALAAAQWTLDNAIYRYTVLNFRRVTDSRGRETLDENRSFRQSSEVTPFGSRPVADLVSKGFVQPDGEGGTMYYAPDAGAFLSDAFLDTHCFGLRSGEDGRIGLTFAPVPDRVQPDIKGVMWIERSAAALRRLEFQYVNLDPVRMRLDAGGYVAFTPLPNGTWIVSEWEIDMPQLVPPSERDLFGRVVRRIQGGVTWRVSDNDGTIVLESATATVAGRVSYHVTPEESGLLSERETRVEGARGMGDDAEVGTRTAEETEGSDAVATDKVLNQVPDSATEVAHGIPGPGHVAWFTGDADLGAHTVRVAVTGESAPVSANGSFLLPGLVAGLQHLEVRHPLLDTLGLRARTYPFNASLGEVAHLELSAPVFAESIYDACYPETFEADRPPLFGRVLRRGAPVADVDVRISWNDGAEWPLGGDREDPPIAMPAGGAKSPPGSGPRRWSFTRDGDRLTVLVGTDPRGVFMLCEPPYGHDLTIAVSKAGESATQVIPEAGGVPVVVLFLQLTQGESRNEADHDPTRPSGGDRAHHRVESRSPKRPSSGTR